MGPFFVVSADTIPSFEAEVNRCIADGYRIINCTAFESVAVGYKTFYAFLEKCRPAPNDVILPRLGVKSET